VTDVNRPQPFDEQAALAELERLAEKIQTSRRQRAQAVEEFDAFVRGFRIERRLESIRAAEAAMSAAASAPEETSPAAPPFIPLVAQSIATAEPIAPVRSDVQTTSDVRSPKTFDDPRIRWAIAFVTVVVLGVLVLRPWRSAAPAVPSSSSAQAPVASTSAPATPQASQSRAADPVPPVPAAPPRALNLELVTIRPVWTRVTVDDKRTIEREIPGGQRLPFGADRSISIRAGDAGAIRVIVDGKDLGILGKDGQIANRSFAARGR
jgi:cytoskeleton protein RodZ